MSPSEAPVQFKGRRGNKKADPLSTAREGVSGSGGSLPHKKTIEKSFGSDMGGVQAHTGPKAAAACEELGAEAYAVGNKVAFKDSSPSVQLAAHEAAHVVQQGAGAQVPGGVGKAGDRHEVAADQAASRASSGKSAADVLPSGGGGGGGRGVQKSESLQLYEEKQISSKKYRVSEDGKMATRQDSVAGSKYSYADNALISSASKKLENATSVMRLEPGSGKLKVPKTFWVHQFDKDGATITHMKLMAEPDAIKLIARNKAGENYVWAAGMGKWMKPSEAPGFGSMAPQAVLSQIDAKNLKSQVGGKSEETSGQSMKMWPDCGRAAHTVSGMDGGSGSGRGDSRAIYTDKKGNEIKSKEWSESIARSEIMFHHFSKELTDKGLRDKIMKAYKEYKAWMEAANKAYAKNDEAAMKKAQAQASLWAEQLNEYSRSVYSALEDDKKIEFEKKVGINRFADPQLGEAYNIQTGGDAKPDAPNGMTWNFHWAGVIMKASGDNMTLEGYADGTDIQNSDWVMQVYGVGNDKPGQTFHEQHRDVHKQHGENPTTMRTGKA